MVKLSADHLLNVINDILDSSKIEAGKSTSSASISTSRDTLDDTVATLVDAPTRKCWNSPQTRPLTLDALTVTACARSSSICWETAIKNTERGEVLSPGRRAMAVGGRGKCASHVAVMTRASASRPNSKLLIFEAFEQADSSTSRRYGGAGLGLAISSQAGGEDAKGGRIWVESGLGKGGPFPFTFPFHRTTFACHPSSTGPPLCPGWTASTCPRRG